VSPRPLVVVSGLTVGDYLLWNWSLNGNHDVLSLVSGLTLVPLAVAALWLLALAIARLLASSARRPAAHARRRVARAASRQHGSRRRGRAAAGGSPVDAPQAANAKSDRPPRKLAA
jgi:hypothetical protein